MPDLDPRHELAEQLRRVWSNPDVKVFPIERRWRLVADTALRALTAHETRCPACGATIRAHMADPPIGRLPDRYVRLDTGDDQ